MAMTPRKNVIQTKYYIYDPAVKAGDEFGRMAVRDDDNGPYILASPLQIQYWLDQGLLGSDPKDKLAGEAKELLKQLTRGRSESDDEPQKLPKYSKAMQSGAPSYAATLAHRRRDAQKKDKDSGKKKQAKKPETKPETKPAAPVVGTTPTS